MAYLERSIERFTDKERLALLRKALSHHGAVTKLNEVEQKDLLALLTKIDAKYQKAFCPLINDEDVVNFVPISDYENFSLSSIPVLTPTYKLPSAQNCRPFCFSTLDSFSARTFGLPEASIPTFSYLVDKVYLTFKNVSLDFMEISTEELNKISTFTANWHKLNQLNFNFDELVNVRYSKEIVYYLHSLLKVSIFGDIPVIPKTNRDPLVILNAFCRCNSLFLFQLRLQRRRIQTFKIDRDAYSTLNEALGNFYDFLLSIYSLFNNENLTNSAAGIFYESLFRLFEEEFVYLKNNQFPLPQ